MHNFKSRSFIVVIVIGFFYLFQLYQNVPWKKEGYFVHDAQSYYSYLPAFIVYNDLSFGYEDSLRQAEPELQLPFTRADGRKVPKMTMGVAILNAPFYVIGRFLAITLDYPEHGYSVIEYNLVSLGALFYAFLALLLFRRVFLYFFNEWLASVGLIMLFLCTNIYFYVCVEPGMSHIYSVFLIAVFIYSTIIWLDKQDKNFAYLTALTFGLMVLVRPTNALFLLVIFLYRIHSLADFKQRITVFWNDIQLLLQLIGLALLFPLIQMIYWFSQTGSFLYNSYVGEHFYFLNPHLFDGLFSYRKGLFIYTPIMLIAMISWLTLLFKWQFKHPLKLVLLSVIPVSLWVVFSWWCWWYGGSFGNRGTIEIMPFMTLVLLLVVHFAGKIAPYLRVLLIPLMVVGMYLNLFQTAQYQDGQIHYDSMTEETYWMAFNQNIDPSIEYYDQLRAPDYQAALDGKNEYLCWNALDSINQTSVIIDLAKDQISTQIEITGELLDLVQSNIGTLNLICSPLPLVKQEDYLKLKPKTLINNKFSIIVPVPDMAGSEVMRVYFLYEGSGTAYYRNLKLKAI